MLGQPIYMLLPEVVGFELTGSLRPGVTATDMTLRIVEMLDNRCGELEVWRSRDLDNWRGGELEMGRI